ncbi:MAG: plasmid stabilization protein [Ignavibacteria bacterium CG_4_8_14_3_um_filter_37_9]|nr:MAG: hypothetical protein AUJ54_00060 [Ignavibacteria bacterium CG1_02_37_35]PIW99774.1 MAG: plasmid stabilization protein [Ignavibacteria bacterium CG_4_8_14_3_um_filter_37_9]PIX94889.1 MAG: plasmid stabilization protein [Ignavibacteria bacterium CG_4_10_14_3_um_filter_37_18]PJC61243.1 MAG: plasmid stabilization protein [Ignavibacteria bacterium CG_4_9_14_0_2_um_filter_37_13]
MKLNWTKEALQRLQAIEDYIARDNIKAAGGFVDNPRKGRVVPELSIENIRELLHKNYRIVYLVKKNSIEILTVFEGHQLLKKDEVLKDKS